MLTLGLAILVAVAIKLVGALLITALLIIPASAGRMMAREPEGMAAYATLMGVAAVFAGLWGSLEFDIPAGPAIVAAASIFLTIVGIFSQRRR